MKKIRKNERIKRERETKAKLKLEETRKRILEIKEKYSKVFELVEKCRTEKRYDDKYYDKISEIVLNMYLKSQIENKKIPQVIAYCTIITFNGTIQEILLVQNGEYLKLKDGTFCWDINSVLGKRCMNGLLEAKYDFICSGYTYFIKDHLFLDKKYRDKNKKKKVDVRIKTKWSQSNKIPKNCIYVFLKLNNLCSTKRHNVESVTLQASDLLKETDVNVNAFYCKDCGFYYMNYETIKECITNNIRPKLKYKIVGNNIFEMNAVSELMLYGYTVREGVLSDVQRRRVLKSLIDSGLMTKYEIIRNIESKVEFNGRKEGNETAKRKWQDDILYVSKYTEDNTRSIKGNIYR